MINRQKNTYIIISVVFFIFAIVFAVQAYFETTKYQNMDLQVLDKKAELSRVTERSKYLKIISVNSEQITRNLFLLGNRIGKSLDFQVVVNDLRVMANSLGKITKLQPGALVEKGDYQEMSVEMTIETDFDSLRRLVYTIKYPENENSRCFRLDGFNYTMDTAGKVTATLELVAFTFSKSPN